MSENIQRETMEFDAVFVGGGVASLSGAIHLVNLVKLHNEEVSQGKRSGTPINDPMIAVVEKASEIGGHSLSGAVMNPVALGELVPNYKEKNCPIEAEASEDAAYFLGRTWSFKFPITPPPFKNKGNYIISLSKFNRWLGKIAEENGVNIFTGFSANEVLYEGNKVVGIQTGDKGLDKNGNPKSNFEPGYILKSKVTIFGEGTRGSLFKRVAQRLGLKNGKDPDVFEEGVKEVIQMPQGTVKAGQVIHTMGWPLSKAVGGTFIYTTSNDQIILGLVAFLDSKDPYLDPHRELQKLKTHPYIAEKIKGGKVIAYGGKTLPAGGWYSMPQLYADGCMVIGDSASLVDVQKLKGIHLAMKSGMLAAETAYEALVKNDFSADSLKSYATKLDGSFIKKQLFKVRHFHQTLSLGWLKSFLLLGFQQLTGGASLVGRIAMHKDAASTLDARKVWGDRKIGQDPDLSLPKPDGVLFFDKLSSVYLTGTSHDENSPNHLLLKDPRICSDTCNPKYVSPCVQFCPAAVYEMVDGDVSGKLKLQINYTNCIHCKTCDIKCPFENIDWTVPEGGGGPKYQQV